MAGVFTAIRRRDRFAGATRFNDRRPQTQGRSERKNGVDISFFHLAAVDLRRRFIRTKGFSDMSIFENLFDQLNVDGQTSLISALGWLLAIQRQLQNTSSDVNKPTDVGNITNVDFNSAENQNEAIS